jgi:hypothetical protein
MKADVAIQDCGHMPASQQAIVFRQHFPPQKARRIDKVELAADAY